MGQLFIFIASFFLEFFKTLLMSKRRLFIKSLIQKKEIELLKRQLVNRKIKIQYSRSDKLFYSLFAFLKHAKKYIALPKPQTLLRWYKELVKGYWTFNHKRQAPGRPQTTQQVKQLILEMKNNNLLWGNGKIQGELLKLDISLDKRTIAKIIAVFRKAGKIKAGSAWKSFIKAHLASMFATDFLTVTTIFGKCYYVFFILHLGTRRIVQYGITDKPKREYVIQQMRNFRQNLNKGNHNCYLIHDNSGEFRYTDYSSFGINSLPISPYAPNMNAFAERFVGSLRREMLDHFIIFGYQQLYTLVKEYVVYYNRKRPHQGLRQKVPDGYTSQKAGRVIAHPVLFGLCHHYERLAA